MSYPTHQELFSQRQTYKIAFLWEEHPFPVSFSPCPFALFSPPLPAETGFWATSPQNGEGSPSFSKGKEKLRQGFLRSGCSSAFNTSTQTIWNVSRKIKLYFFIGMLSRRVSSWDFLKHLWLQVTINVKWIHIKKISKFDLQSNFNIHIRFVTKHLIFAHL